MSSSVHLFSLRLFSYFFLSFLPSVRSLRLNVYGSFGRIWRVSNRCHFSTNDDDSENRFDKAFISRLMMLRRLAQMSSSLSFSSSSGFSASNSIFKRNWISFSNLLMTVNKSFGYLGQFQKETIDTKVNPRIVSTGRCSSCSMTFHNGIMAIWKLPLL